MSTGRGDIYERVTDVIVKAIEEGAESYRMPWRTSGEFPHSPINAVTKKAYNGINVVLLWAVTQKKNYRSGLWATYKQWQELGAQVRKGEESAHIVFWKFFENEELTSAEEEAKRTRVPMARDYFVFNAEQVTGFTPPRERIESDEERIQSAEDFFAGLGVKPKEGGNSAYYSPKSDSVYMPPFEAFKEALYYYAVLAHEVTHWTGAEHRLNRDLSGRFGCESYAFEELIAELGAAFLSSELGLPSDPRRDNAPYIASWLTVLKGDKRAIFTAAAKAQQAADWLRNQKALGTAARERSSLLRWRRGRSSFANDHS